MASTLPAAVERRLLAIFEDPVVEREAAVAELCRRHPDHADRIRERLVAAEAAVARLDDALAADELPGRIGPYRTVSLLGHGGMGTVYLADQVEPVQRRVALKVVKLGMDSRAVLHRFQLERQALALMNHDHIARVFDAGVTERGQPYFVMEYVAGQPMTIFCDRQKLPIDARIRLFQQVCAGVQHAHQKGVIHRDLKPSNVLVSADQGRPVPKIIDFGLARATDRRWSRATMTAEGHVVGTPDYMSPEQADPSSADIDTRTDIYSLGVMLYELLVGVAPFARDDLWRLEVAELQRRIREVEPPRPSSRLPSTSESSADVARARGTTPAALSRALRSDLDWIVLKAIAKDRSRRYESASALAADLGRYLAHEPVLAGPPGAAYRLRKFVRRHRAKVTGAVGVLLVTITAALIVMEQSRRQRAETRARVARELHESARSEARTGHWSTALGLYETARASGYPDEIGISIGEIEALEGNLDYPQAQQELARLYALGEDRLAAAGHLAKVLLLDADLAIDRLADPDRKLGLVRRALDLGGLSPADEAFARALIATDVVEAMKHLEAARLADPHHRRANDMFGIALLCTGRLQDAVRFAERLTALYPEDPSAMIYALFVHALHGTAAEVADLSALIRVRHPESRKFASFTVEVARLVGWANRTLIESLVADEPRTVGQYLQSLGFVALRIWPMYLGLRSREDEAAGLAFTRLAPSIVRSYRPLSEVLRNRPSPDALLARLEANRDTTLDGAVHFVHGMALSLKRRFEEGEAAFQRAVDTPSIIVWHKTALLYLLNVQGLLWEEQGRPDALRRRCIGTISRLVDLADLAPAELRHLWRFCGFLGDHGDALEIASRWSRQHPDDTDASRALAASLRSAGAEASTHEAGRRAEEASATGR